MIGKAIFYLSLGALQLPVGAVLGYFVGHAIVVEIVVKCVAGACVLLVCNYLDPFEDNDWENDWS